MLCVEVEEELLVREIGGDREGSRLAAKYALSAGWSISASKARSAICCSLELDELGRDRLFIGQNILEKITSDFENEGAVNILPKNEEFNTKSGIEGIKFYGSFDLKNVRCSFFSIAFVFNEVFIELKMIYDKEDRYGKKIEDRILDSLEIIEEL